MVEDVTLYPPHPVMFVGDPEEESPDVDGASLINVAPAVISVGTLPDVDGPTTIRLADEEDLLRLPEHLAFEWSADASTPAPGCCRFSGSSSS